MKRLLCLMLILLMPIYSLAETAVYVTADVPLLLPGTNPGISDCLPLPGGGALLNVLTTGELDGTNPNPRTYAVYPMDENLLFGDSIALFTLAEGHSLGAVVACGDGFLLTEHFPWEWQQPARSALSHLAMDGTRTVLAPELIFPRGDSALLIPSPDEHHAAIILRDADAHRFQTFGH